MESLISSPQESENMATAFLFLLLTGSPTVYIFRDLAIVIALVLVARHVIMEIA